MPVYHIDAYRLRDEDEFRQLGPEEYFEGRGLVLIEWADRVRSALPAERMEIDITVTGGQSRRFALMAIGGHYAAVLDAVAARLS